MKKITTTLALLALATSALAQETKAPVHPDTTTWQPLFKADLSDAETKAGVWSIQDGALTASADEAIWSKAEYETFQLDLEFKTDPGTNSGVVVHASDIHKWIPNSVEIQIADDHSDKWGKGDKKAQCGAIYGHQAASEQKLVKKPGEWNRMTVTCKGPLITVALNGKMVTDIDMKKWTSATKNPDGSDIPGWLSNPMATMATKGRVGLQGKHGDATIYYRNIKLKAE